MDTIIFNTNLKIDPKSGKMVVTKAGMKYSDENLKYAKALSCDGVIQIYKNSTKQ